MVLWQQHLLELCLQLVLATNVDKKPTVWCSSNTLIMSSIIDNISRCQVINVETIDYLYPRKFCHQAASKAAKAKTNSFTYFCQLQMSILGGVVSILKVWSPFDHKVPLLLISCCVYLFPVPLSDYYVVKCALWQNVYFGLSKILGHLQILWVLQKM